MDSFLLMANIGVEKIGKKWTAISLKPGIIFFAFLVLVKLKQMLKFWCGLMPPFQPDLAKIG